MIAPASPLAAPFRWTPMAAWRAMTDALRPVTVLLRACLPHTDQSFQFTGDVESERMRAVGQIHRLAVAGRAAVLAYRGQAPGRAPGRAPGCDTINDDVAETNNLLLLVALATDLRDAWSHEDVVDAVSAVERLVTERYRDLVLREGQYDAWDGEYSRSEAPGGVPERAVREVANA